MVYAGTGVLICGAAAVLDHRCRFSWPRRDSTVTAVSLALSGSQYLVPTSSFTHSSFRETPTAPQDQQQGSSAMPASRQSAAVAAVAVATGLASFAAQAFVVPPSSSALFSSSGFGDVRAAAGSHKSGVAIRRSSRSSVRMDTSAGEEGEDEEGGVIMNRFSRNLTQKKSQGASQAMLYATGLTTEDMTKAQVGVSSVWFEGNPCNMHLLDLAKEAKDGVVEEGMVGYRFNTIGVSDGISMGTSGMSFSLQSRDVIADSIETVMGGQWYDANIAIPGCDKNMPGCLIAMGRVNRPSIMVYGGTIRAGHAAGESLDIVSAFQAYGEFAYDRISEEQRQTIVENACPGPGACGGMYTANTMASAIEALGMSLPYSSSTPADDPMKKEECHKAAKAVRNMLEKDLKPKDIVTRASFENAIVTVMALGGSTNAVLHLIAMARAFDIELTIDDFQTISDKVPFVADLKPSGKYVMEDLQGVGGIPAVLKMLMEEGLVDGSCMTVTGKTMAENLAELPGLKEGQEIIKPMSDPIKSSGHLQILYGNVAPGGAVAKITGKEGLTFSGVAKVYDSEEDMLESLARKEITPGMVVVIRYEGPKGGPGMPEMLTPSSAIMGAGLGSSVALITDGRFSGGSHGFIIGHITPEAQEGGPIALLQDDDPIVIDAEKRTISVLLSSTEMDKRRQDWVPPPPAATKGTLFKYIKNVASASEGCVTDE